MKAMENLVGSPEACGRPRDPYVAEVDINPLAAAIHLAFSEHRPLILTPDAVWITIVQGVAQHVALDPERWRSRLVPHAGKAKIVVARDDLIPGDSENPWDEIVETFRQQVIRCSLLNDRLTAEFSTTGPHERLAQSIVLMDVVAPYYDYEVSCICGIPDVSLAGKVEDWELLAAKVEGLPDLGLESWYSALRPICAEFARAAGGRVAEEHWRRIYKWSPSGPYEPNLSTGWFLQLFPYLMHDEKPCVPNPLLGADPGEGVGTGELPGGMSRVPLTWSDPMESVPLVLSAGLAGVVQEGLALRPAINWAVSRKQSAKHSD